MKTILKKHRREWSNLGPEDQRRFLVQAQHLIEKSYPVPEKDVYKLAEMLYNKSH